MWERKALDVGILLGDGRGRKGTWGEEGEVAASSNVGKATTEKSKVLAYWSESGVACAFP